MMLSPSVVRYTAAVQPASLTQKPRVVILMPAYHAGKRIINACTRIPEEYAHDVLVSDDASADDTFACAQTLPVRASRNERNLGYGGNMKLLLQRGLETDGEVFIELHADGQYDPAVIPDVLHALKPTDGMLLGSRTLRGGEALRHGMPLHKYVMNWILTGVANAVLGTRLTEFHTGFRVYTRPYLERVNFLANSDDHLFSFETILQAVYSGFTVTEIPVVCTYEAGVRQMGLWKGVKYTVEMLWTLVRYALAKSGRPDPVFQPREAR